MVLLLGASGYIGEQFVTELRNKNVGFLPLSRSNYDYTRLDILTDLIKENNPRFLINCAGYTGKPNVDACEENHWDTFEGNVILPRTIATACKKFDLPWGHVSSGCIYDGNKSGETNLDNLNSPGFTELDEPNLGFLKYNCSYYSGTKVLGEENIREIGGDCYVWRLRMPFDKHDNPRNYLTKLIKYEKLLDAVNSITHREDFARCCVETWLNKCPFGIYNIVNTKPITTRVVRNKIEKFLNLDKKASYFLDEKQFYSTAAKARRSNCVLSNQKLLDTGIKIRSAEEALDDSLKSWIKSG